MKDTDVAWAAGFFEGEGTVVIAHSTTSWHMHCGCAQKEKAPLEFLQKLFGGSISKTVQGEKTLSPGSFRYDWRLNGHKALPLVEGTLLFVKTLRLHKRLLVYKEFLTADADRRLKLYTWWRKQ